MTLRLSSLIFFPTTVVASLRFMRSWYSRLSWSPDTIRIETPVIISPSTVTEYSVVTRCHSGTSYERCQDSVTHETTFTSDWESMVVDWFWFIIPPLDPLLLSSIPHENPLLLSSIPPLNHFLHSNVRSLLWVPSSCSWAQLARKRKEVITDKGIIYWIFIIISKGYT